MKRFSSTLLFAGMVFLAACGSGGSSSSDSVSYPSAPVNLVATPGDSQVTMAWDRAEGDNITYIMYMTTQAGITKENYASMPMGPGMMGMKITDVTSPNAQTGLVNGIRYYCVITAVNEYGESEESMEMSAVPVSGG